MSLVHPISIDARWLVGDELHLCLVQTAPPGNMDEIKNDVHRPANVALVKHLLQGVPGVSGGSPFLTELMPGGDPCVVMVPEYAFGSGDWDELNAMIRSITRPLVLLAGFGAARGSVLRTWSATGAGAAPQLLEAQDNIAMTSRYNGGWCWVHHPGRFTVCYCFLKTFAEQRVECVEIPDLAFGTKLLVLEFQDLLVAPGICAELLCDQPDGWCDSLQQWILQPGRDHTKQILLAGLLYEPGPGHAIWRNAISRALERGRDLRSPARPIVALANHATSRPVWNEEQDTWRSQSGVFSLRTTFMSQEHLPYTRKVFDRVFLGVLIRRDEPCAVGGRVRWSGGATVGRFLWHAGHCARVSPSGQGFLDVEMTEGAEYECSRILRRLSLPIFEKDGSKIEQLTDNRTSLCQFASRPGQAPLLVYSIIKGLEGGQQANVPSSKDICGWLQAASRRDALDRGLVALLFLHASGCGEWSDESAPGQLHGIAVGRHVHTLVWCSPDMNGRLMMRAVQAWIGGVSHAPALLVVGCPDSGTLEFGRVRRERRRDVSEPDVQVTGRSASWPDAEDARVAYVLNLNQLADYYPWQDFHSDDVSAYINRILAG